MNVRWCKDNVNLIEMNVAGCHYFAVVASSLESGSPRAFNFTLLPQTY